MTAIADDELKDSTHEAEDHDRGRRLMRNATLELPALTERWRDVVVTDGTRYTDDCDAHDAIARRLEVEDTALRAKVVLSRHDGLCGGCYCGYVWSGIEVEFQAKVKGEWIVAAQPGAGCDTAISISTERRPYLPNLGPFALVPAFARLFALATADAERRGWFTEPKGPRRCLREKKGEEGA